MGYCGLGMQRWISTMKPRKFLAKRGKPDGGGGESMQKSYVEQYYTLKKSSTSKRMRKVNFTRTYKLQLLQKMRDENRKQLLITILSILIAIVIVGALCVYGVNKIQAFL